MNTTQIITRVKASGYGADTDAEMLELINTSGRELYGERIWEWNRQQTDLSFTAGLEEVAVPAGYSRPIDAALTDGTVDLSNDFEYLTPQRFEDARGARVTIPASERGRPTYWTISRGFVRVFPVPAQTYTVRLYYVKDWQDLTAGQDPQTINGLPNDYHDILVSDVIVEMALRDRDWQMADRYALIAERRKRQLRNEHRTNQQTGRVDSSYWDEWNFASDPDSVLF